MYHFTKLDEIPPTQQEVIFEKLFSVAEIVQFNPEQVKSYENSLKYYRDLKNSIDTAWEEGREEGREAGREETRLDIAKSLLAEGMAEDMILRTTGLTATQLQQLQGGDLLL